MKKIGLTPRLPGFTLVELIVSISIIAVITGLFLANYYSGEGGSNLINATQNLLRDFRYAQSNSLGIVSYGSTTPTGGWGVYLNKASSSYLVFADMNGNMVYDSGEADTDKGGREINLPPNTSFENFSLDSPLNIVFLANSSTPAVNIKGGGATSTDIDITVKDDINSGYDNVRINTAGLINSHDSLTKLLLHARGINDSTRIIDYSPSEHAITNVGNKVLTKTADKKFGTASLYFNRTDSYLSWPDNEDFNFSNKDFTVEMWLKYSSADNYHTLLTQSTSGATSNSSFYFGVNYNGAGTASIYLTNGGGNWDQYFHTPSASLNDNVWHHLAYVRVGDRILIFIDGVKKTDVSLPTGYVINNSSRDIRLGVQDQQYYYGGYMDELRISKGVARYTADFTPSNHEY